MLQPLSVACISLAAKMEESEVPILLDLQVSFPVFQRFIDASRFYERRCWFHVFLSGTFVRDVL